MKFKFNLETLLSQRLREVDFAKKEYYEAQKKVDDIIKKIEMMWTEISESRIQMVKEQNLGGKKGQLLSSIDEFINGHKIRIEREKIVLRELLMIAEEKKEALIESAKEHKILERLKEKRFEEFKVVKKKKEAKENDDIATMRFKRSSI